MEGEATEVAAAPPLSVRCCSTCSPVQGLWLRAVSVWYRDWRDNRELEGEKDKTLPLLGHHMSALNPPTSPFSSLPSPPIPSSQTSSSCLPSSLTHHFLHHLWCPFHRHQVGVARLSWDEGADGRHSLQSTGEVKPVDNL